MKCFFHAAALTALLAAGGAAAMSGCTSTEERAQQASSDVLATKAEVDKGIAEIDVVLAKLNALTDKHATDLETRFDAYQEEIARLDEIAALVRARADSMKASGDKYFEAWSKELKDANETQAEAHTRRIAQYKDIQSGFQYVRDAYRPFVGTIKEIEAALDKETTFVNVVRLEPSFKTARSQHAETKKRLTFVDERLRAFATQVKAR